MKRFFLMITLIGTYAFSSTCPLPAFATGLKQNSIIKDSTIKLGDIFYDLPRDEDRVLGTAPRPGQEMVLNARTLLRIAVALDLPWRPTDASDHIVLRREASIVGYTQIEEAIRTALYDERVHGEYDIEIPSQYHKIVLPADVIAQVEVTRFKIDADRKNFEATLAAPSAKDPIQHLVVTGKISPILRVPVLSDNLQNGHIINARDIHHVNIAEREFTRDTIVDADALIGMTARRMIIADRPIKKSDLIAPQVVERGALVNLSLRDSVMRITTQAKALENGATGDVIRVVNTASNKTIQARVTGPNEVVILN